MILHLRELDANMAGQEFHPLAGQPSEWVGDDDLAQATDKCIFWKCPTCERLGRWLKIYRDVDYEEFQFWAYCPTCGDCEKL